MSDGTKIEWTDATWNVINGCSVVSPGCTNCYAMKLAGTRFRTHPTREGLTQDSKAGPVWNGKVRLIENMLDQPIRWKTPRMIFVCAHGDLFHEAVPEEWIDQVFAVMACAPQHIFQVLTKRPERMRKYLTTGWHGRIARYMKDLQKRPAGHGILLETTGGVLPNVWLGTSVEDQTRASERIPSLLTTPAAKRWLSMEPLLGPVNLTGVDTYRFRGAEYLNALTGELYGILGEEAGLAPGLDWVVLGGESGTGSRPMHPDWARKVRDDCEKAGVPFLFKQWGDWAGLASWPAGRYVPDEDKPRHTFQGGVDAWRVGKKEAGRLLDNVTHDGFPHG